jgi:hypothetical protein
MPAPTGAVGILGAIGYGRETAYGTAAAVDNWVPFKSEGLTKNISPEWIEMIRGVRARDQKVVRGPQHVTGSVQFAVFPQQGLHLLAGALADRVVYSNGTTPTGSATLSQAVSAGDTSFQSATSIAQNSYVLVGTADAAGHGEVRKVVSVTGSGPYTMTVDRAFAWPHASGAAVKTVTAPFTHVVALGNTLPSYTVEKQFATLAGLRYTGMVVNRLSFKVPARADLDVTIDFIGQDEAELTAAQLTAATYVAENPWEWAQASITFAGGPVATLNNFELDLDNGVKEYHALSGQRYPAVVLPGPQVVRGRVGIIYSDNTYHASFSSLANTGTLQAGWTDASGNQVQWALTDVRLVNWRAPIRLGDIIVQEIDWEAAYDPAAAPPTNVLLTVTTPLSAVV